MFFKFFRSARRWPAILNAKIMLFDISGGTGGNRKPPIGSLGGSTILNPGAPDPQKQVVKKNSVVQNHVKNPFQTISNRKKINSEYFPSTFCQNAKKTQISESKMAANRPFWGGSEKL